MNLPNKISLFRLILAPVFFLSMLIPVWSGSSHIIFLVLSWVVFGLIEYSDILDGHLARKLGQVTDIGKVLDPFSDVISRVTYFLCFTYIGLMPVWMFALILYRELGQTFIRMYMTLLGKALAANKWGKIKSVLYGVSAGVGLLLMTLYQFGVRDIDWMHDVVTAIFGLAAASALISFVTYLKGVINEARQ